MVDVPAAIPGELSAPRIAGSRISTGQALGRGARLARTNGHTALETVTDVVCGVTLGGVWWYDCGRCLGRFG